MTNKKRDIIYRNWNAVINRDARDLAALDMISRRALVDRDVRGDPTLEGMVQADLQRRRADLERDLQAERSRTAHNKTAPSDTVEPVAEPTISPEQVQKTFDNLSANLLASLEVGDDGEAQSNLSKIRALQQQHPGIISSATVATHEQRVVELRAHIKQLTDSIAALTEQAVAASERGQEETLAETLKHLTAIHAAHPSLLDEAGLDKIRIAALNAVDEHQQHKQATHAIIKLERSITSEIRKLALAVRKFHKVACSSSGTGTDFQKAEAVYLRVIQRMRTYDTEWFSGVVLELADLLAVWSVPPAGVESQIDRFLDGIHAGLKSVRAEMREIERKQDAMEN